MPWETRRLEEAPVVTAPDGSTVHVLAAGSRGSMAQFSLAPGAVSRAVMHRGVEELWFIRAGQGRMWRRDDATGEEGVTALAPGVSLSIPPGTRFQFRCDGDVPLLAVGVTMPPWPGEEEAVPVEGIWPAA